MEDLSIPVHEHSYEVTIEFDGYRIRINHGQSGVVVYGCDCVAIMDKEQVIQVREELGKWLEARDDRTGEGEE